MDKLYRLGYSSFFEEVRKSPEFESLTPARIVEEHKELYRLSDGEKEMSAQVTGKMIFTASSREDFPAVGDWVLIEPAGEKTAIIKSILPRQTLLKRKAASRTSDVQIIAANIDGAFIMQAADRDYNLKRLERYLSLTRSGGIDASVILNKTDKTDAENLKKMLAEISSRFEGVRVFATSLVTKEGIEELRSFLAAGKTYCFIGSSGVGKSSLLNYLMARDAMKTGEISESVERGKHVTTHRQLFSLQSGALVIDTPGMREIGVVDSQSGIADIFSEFESLASECRFSDCTHTHEPGCAVIDALKSGEIDEERYENYMKLLKENKHNTMSGIKRRQSDRQFSKILKDYNKNHRKR